MQLAVYNTDFKRAVYIQNGITIYCITKEITKH